MQHSWLKFLHFLYKWLFLCFYISHTKQTIPYLKVTVCFVLKASPWLLASKVTFYFILTPFPARCKLVIWLLCGEFLLKFCPVGLGPAKRVSRGPRRRHQSPALPQSSSWDLRSWWTQLKGSALGSGIPAWHKAGSSFLSSAGKSCTKQTLCNPPVEVRAWGHALALPSSQFLPQLQVAVTNP